MRYHLKTKTAGTWVGGFMARKDVLEEQLMELRDTATMWGDTLIATRLDGKRRGDTIEIHPG